MIQFSGVTSKSQSLDQPSSRIRHTLALVLEYAPLEEIA
jgi:hypothetical protein